MENLQTQNQNTQLTPIKAFSNFFQGNSIKKKFDEVLGQNASGFISSVVSVVSQNNQLLNATHESIYGAALVAASLQLPIIPSLGLAYIVPYNQKVNGQYMQVAQFQISYKGLHQLALRSGKYETIHTTDVRQGELINIDRMTGEMEFQWVQDNTERNKLPIIGYISYFKLISGFKSTFYMTLEEIQGHALKYSKSYAKYKTGLWKDEFETMAMKTVSKLHLNRKGILSIEMERAIKFDGSEVKNANPETNMSANAQIINIEANYVDNDSSEVVDAEFDYDAALNETLEQERQQDAKVLEAQRQMEIIVEKQKNNQKL